MDSKLRENIGKYGGKAGGLVTLQDTQLADNVTSFHLLDYSQALTERKRQDLIRWQEGLTGKDQFIIRSAHPGDWDGLVDVMETKRTPISQIDETLEAVNKSLSDLKLIEFAKQEGINFREEDCKILVVPDLGQDSCTLTEHPNTENELIMFDDFLGGVYCQHDYFPQEKNWNIFHREAMGLRSKVQELLGDSDEAWQYEMTPWHDGQAFVHQLRSFAKKKVLGICPDENFVERTKSGIGIMRWMGSTYTPWPESLQEKWASMEGYSDSGTITDRYNPMALGLGLSATAPFTKMKIGVDRLDQFEKKHLEVPYILLNELQSDKERSDRFLSPKNAQVYLGAGSCLSHYHTKYAQKVLRKEGGAVFLSSRTDYLGVFKMLGNLLSGQDCSDVKNFMMEVFPGKRPQISYAG